MSEVISYTDEPERVPVEAAGDTSPQDLFALCADRFLFKNPDEMQEHQVTAFLHQYPDNLVPMYPWRTELVLEASFHPITTVCRPAPSRSGKRGFVRNLVDGHLQITEDGKPVSPVFLDAMGDVSPVWSRDGQFLAYVSDPLSATQSLLKTAYPREATLARAAARSDWHAVWSSESDWLAILSRAWGRLWTLSVRVPPTFEKELISAGRVGHLAALHDGSLAYIQDGKVFIWRRGWKGPVCVYDPGKKTLGKEIEG